MQIELHIDPVNRQRDGLATIFFFVPGSGEQRQLDISLGSLFERCGVPDPIALDFLIAASAIYAIDKTIPRSEAFDNWTREFELTVPVSDPDLWRTAAGELEDCLRFLSGDIWQLSFSNLPGSLYRRPVKKRTVRSYNRMLLKSRADCVCLFSGGLDSLAGAIDLLSSRNLEHLLLVGHYDAAGPASTQKRLFDELKPEFPGRADILQVRVSHKPEASGESSQRTRSLVFMALGINAARSFGQDVPLYAPENGLIALNIPLTPSRSGSCSTRTMHPFFLDKLASALSCLTISNPIINPFELKTKGACVAECEDIRLLHSLVDLSVSCAHPSRRQDWIRREAGNCGYCIPCIFRRAALHQADIDDGDKYGIDFCTGELSANDPGESANDLRAITDFLRKGKGVENLTREILLVAQVDRVNERASMAAQGFDEIRSLIRTKGNRNLRIAART